jgi:tetratricopeptide (TPR) repeat protein
MGRIAIFGTVLFALFFGWAAIRMQIGSMIAGLTAPADPNAGPASELAMRLVSNDPAATWLRANVTGGDAGLRLLEETVRLSPFDYHWRVELARAYEQNDRPELAEKEFERAAELAPNYAFVHWHLGNFYLRQERVDDAMSEFRRAAENNRTYREQVFSLTWDYFDKDPAKVEDLASDTADSRAALALFFAARGEASESLRIWNQLTAEQKSANPETARAIALGLFQQKHFAESLEFARQLGIDAEARPYEVTNPGFERTIGSRDDSLFGWKITRSDARFDASVDPSVRHEGGRSLKLSFRSYTKPELYNIYQTVVVEPGTSYRLSFWVRTENLKSSGPPLLEVLNANDDKMLASTRSYSTGTNDWQQISVEFRTPANCSAVTLRTARSFCGDQCPIIGTVWYDEFALAAN